MGRKKERCPQCGSGKIQSKVSSKKCKTCGFEWEGKIRKKQAKKDKVRFIR